jgi:hypothetical protein
LRDFEQQPVRDVLADGCDAIDTESDGSLEVPIVRPIFRGRVVSRDVVRDEVQIRCHHPSSLGSSLRNVAASIDLIGVPRDIGLWHWRVVAVQLDAREITKVFGICR